MTDIQNIRQLEEIYGTPRETATIKVTDHITDYYRKMIEASPFLVLATCGPEGLDASPRGDQAGFVRIVNKKMIQIPDRRGNNRIDSLRNIVRDPRVALLIFLPGCGNTLRINATATITVDPDICRSFEVAGESPRSVIVINVNEVYFQCARAIVRSELWNPDRHVDQNSLPTPGAILAELSDNRVGGEAYDRKWPDRARKSLW